MEESNMFLTAKQIISKSKILEQQSIIYFLIKNKKIVYVGQSTVGMHRISSHIYDKEFDSYSYIHCPSDRLNDFEAYYIALLSPEYNKSIPLNNLIKSKNQIKKELNINGHKFNSITRTFNIKPIYCDYYCIDTFRKALRVKEGEING